MPKDPKSLFAKSVTISLCADDSSPARSEFEKMNAVRTMLNMAKTQNVIFLRLLMAEHLFRGFDYRFGNVHTAQNPCDLVPSAYGVEMFDLGDGPAVCFFF